MNRFRNAGFLEGPTGWAATALVAAVDEATHGAPGRAALVAAGTVSGATTAQVATSTGGRATVASGEIVEMSACVGAWIADAPVAPEVRLTFREADGDVVDSVAVPVAAPGLARWGVGLNGVRETFWTAFLRTTVPDGAERASLEIEATPAATSAVKIALLKPFLGGLSGLAAPRPRWDPGVHGDVALQRDVFPALLRDFDAGAGAESKPWGVAFDAGAGAPAQRRTTNDPARKLTARMRCDPWQRATLERFAAASTAFWIEEPDSGRLCLGRFAADGAPRYTGAVGVMSIMEMSLWLETA